MQKITSKVETNNKIFFHNVSLKSFILCFCWKKRSLSAAAFHFTREDVRYIDQIIKNWKLSLNKPAHVVIEFLLKQSAELNIFNLLRT